jgi:phosphoribosylformylglycinamidine (FGAM) synthase-like amidotransferase family enzyme
LDRAGRREHEAKEDRVLVKESNEVFAKGYSGERFVRRNVAFEDGCVYVTASFVVGSALEDEPEDG